MTQSPFDSPALPDRLPPADAIHDITERMRMTLGKRHWTTSQGRHVGRPEDLTLGRRKGRLCEVWEMSVKRDDQPLGPNGNVGDSGPSHRTELVCYPTSDFFYQPFDICGRTIIINGRIALDFPRWDFDWVSDLSYENRMPGPMTLQAFSLPYDAESECRSPDVTIRLEWCPHPDWWPIDRREPNELSQVWTLSFRDDVNRTASWCHELPGGRVQLEARWAEDNPKPTDLINTLLASAWRVQWGIPTRPRFARRQPAPSGDRRHT